MANVPKNERMVDLRVVNRYIASGRLAAEDYTAHLESLPDLSDNVRPRDEGGDDDGYDRPIAANESRRLPLSAMLTRPRVALDDDDDDDDFEDDEGDDDDDDDADEADAPAEPEAGPGEPDAG